MTGLSLDIIRQLPKAELHCHLDGAIRPETVLELAKEQGVELPTNDLEELRRMIEVPPDCPSLEVYLRSFAVTLLVLQRADAITRAIYEICEDAVADGVRYLEVRFAPVLHTERGLSYSTIMEACCQGVTLAEARLPITVRVIVCGMRHLDSAVSESMAEIAWRYSDRGVCAFDLAGPENGFPSRDHATAFSLIHKHWLNCTLHSGEAFGPASINDSLRYCNAHRIGHGVRLEEDPVLLEYVRTRRIPLEMCPTSNVQTKAVGNMADHPIARYLRSGLVVVPCTDNPSVSNVRLSGEYHTIQEQFNLTVPEIVRLIYNGFSSAFLNPVARSRMVADVLAECARVLSAHGIDPAEALAQFSAEPAVGAGFPCIPAPASAPASPGREAVPLISAIERIPKVDLSVRVDRSVPRDRLWGIAQLYTADQARAYLGHAPQTEDELLGLVVTANDAETAAGDSRAKRVLSGLMQTPETLRAGVAAIIEAGAADNVVYMELQLVPSQHVHGPMAMADVVDHALASVTETVARLGGAIDVNVVLCACVRSDRPVSFHRVASLAVERRTALAAAAAGTPGVVGFGVVGGEISEDQIDFYRESFALLKNRNMPITMAAGRAQHSAVSAALHQGGASRISTPYTLHSDPAAMAYTALHSIPVELADTMHLDSHTGEVRSFVPSVARLYFDAKINLCICSVAQALTGRTLSEMIASMVHSSQFNTAETIVLLSNPARAAFLPFEHQERLAQRIVAAADAVFGELGTPLRQKWWFPDSN